MALLLQISLVFRLWNSFWLDFSGAFPEREKPFLTLLKEKTFCVCAIYEIILKYVKGGLIDLLLPTL